MTESMNPNMPERLARRDNNLAVVERFYLAAATHDTSKVVPVLTEDFVGTTTEGLPNGLGGVYHGNENAVARIWGRIWSLFDMNGEVYEFLPVDDDRVIVLGRYVGHTQDGSSPVFAAFAHIFTVRGDRVAALRQITDSAQWQQFGRAQLVSRRSKSTDRRHTLQDRRKHSSVPASSVFCFEGAPDSK